MTTYITIEAQKRNFTVLANMPDFSPTAVTMVRADDTRIARNGDIRIARNGDTRIAHNTVSGYPRLIKGVEKRKFQILAKVKNG